MKKFILPILISLAPLFLKAQPLACDIQINGVSFSTYDLCVGEDVTLNGTPSGGTTPYSHAWSGSSQLVAPLNGVTVLFQATTPGVATIQYTVTDAALGTCTDQIIITVNPLPSLFTSKNDTVCLGECTNITAITLGANAGDALYWYPGYIGNPVGDTLVTGTPPLSLTINVCPTSDTVYIAMAVISATSCIRTKAVTIEVCDLTVTATGSPNPICKNDSSCLTATPNGCGPTYSYIWSPTDSMDDPTSGTPCVWPMTNTNYCVTVTDDLTGCTASTCFQVTVNPQNPPTITPPQDTICYGDCITLTASGSGNSWEWDPGGELTAAITVCPTVTTVYTVTMTDATGCTASEDATVTVSPQIFAEAGPPKWMCYGDSVQLGGSPTGSGGISPYTYNWSPSGGNSSNPWVSPTSTTTFTVTVTDAAGCTATDNVVVTVNPQIIINPGNPVTLCNGACANLGGSPTVSGGTPPYVIAWTPAGGLSCTSCTNPTACPAATTTYVINVTDNVGCTESASVQVTVNPNPTANAGNDQTICSGACVTIGGSPTASGTAGPFSYAWSPATGLNSTTAANPQACPTATTTYCVTITDVPTGCTASDCVIITVNPSPTANAGTDQTLCAGNCVAIGGAPTASGGTPGYTYNWSPAGSLNSSTIANPTACPLTTTTYCVTVTDALGCTASDCVTITVNTATATAVANPNPICSGSCSNITATGGGTYQWSNGATTAVINVCPVVTTTYTVTVTATNGCTAVASATVTVNSVNVTASATTNPLCPPACTDITATPSGGTTPYTYQWSNPPGGTTQTVNVCPTTTTTYTVTVTDANTCSNTATVTVTVYSATASATPNPICSGQCTTVSATGGGTYAWSSGQSTASFIACPTSTTTYTVTVTNGGCTTTASVTVNVTAIAGVAAPLTIPICLGNCTTIDLTPSGGVAPYSYAWSPATGLNSTTVQDPQACPTTTTTYTCTITDANGCAGTATTTVTVVTASVTGNPMSVCAGDTAMLVATGGGTYQWSTPPGGINDTVFVAPATTTTYTVTVTNAGCTASANFTVTVGAFTIAASANPNNVCAGSGTPVQLSTSMGSSYSWVSNPPGFTSNIQNPVVTPVVTTTYTVTVTSSGGCTASASVTVTVDDLAASVLSTPVGCAGDCITLTITFGGGTPPYTYSWCCGLGSGSSAIVCPTGSTTVTCTITDALGCSDVASITLNPQPLPVPVITPPSQNICDGAIATMTASGGISYSWSANPNDASLTGQENNATINVTPSVTTTYCVTVTGANGCTADTCAVVNVTTAPVACIDPNTSICSGDCITITACGGSNYAWSTPPGGNANPITVCPATTTTYTVSVTQNGCTETSTTSVTITVVSMPSVTLSASDGPVICSGTCVTFIASVGASNYNFFVNGSSVQNGGSNTFTTCTLTNPSSVFVIATNGAVCSDTSAVINFTVNPTPIITITNPIPPSICLACDGSLGTNVVGGTAPYTYSWSDSQTGSTAVNLCAGSYNVTVTDANACSASTSGVLSDPGAPAITLTCNPDTICDGDCITCTAGGTAVTFEFLVNSVSMQGPGGSNTFTYCAFNDGDQVTVEGTDIVGCVGLSNPPISIQVDALPVQFSITGGLPFCTGGCSNIGLNGSASGVNYLLYLNGLYHGPTVPGTGSPISFGCISDTGSFSIYALNAAGCQNNMFGWVDVIENPLPTLFTVTGGGTMCADSSGIAIGLNGSQLLPNGVSYQVIIDGVLQDTTIIGTGGAISFGNWTIPGTYQIVATNIETTCSDTMNLSAIINVVPIPTQYTVTGGGAYCAGGIGVFIGLSDSDPGVPYNLYNGVTLVSTQTGTGSAFNFPPGLFTAAGNYYVIANSGACNSNMYDTVTVTINAAPAISAGVDATICEGSSTQLNASGGNSYLWNTTDNIANPIVSPVVNTTYTVTGTDLNGCTASDTVVITVLPFTYPIATAADSVFCSYETVNTVISVVPAGYTNYQWNTGAFTPTITVLTAGCYTVTATAANGCSASDQICIVQNPPMQPAQIVINGSPQFCEPDSIELSLNNPYYTYDWSSGSVNESSIFVLETGNYYVTVTDSFGCRDTAGPAVITVDPLPNAIISYVDQDNIQHTFDFYNNSLYSTSQEWDFGDGNSSTGSPVSHDYDSTGNVMVTLIAYNNCGSDTDTVYINVHEPFSGLTENSGIFDFDLYPNPTKDIINMDFTLGDAEKISFIMYDALGQEMINDERDYMSGEQHKELSLAELAKGVYVLKVNTGKGSFIRRVIKD